MPSYLFSHLKFILFNVRVLFSFINISFYRNSFNPKAIEEKAENKVIKFEQGIINTIVKNWWRKKKNKNKEELESINFYIFIGLLKK